MRSVRVLKYVQQLLIQYILFGWVLLQMIVRHLNGKVYIAPFTILLSAQVYLSCPSKSFSGFICIGGRGM